MEPIFLNILNQNLTPKIDLFGFFYFITTFAETIELIN